MRLDFGDVAGGLPTDKMLAILAEKGFPQAIVRAGNDIRVGDPPRGAATWRLRVPVSNPGGDKVIVVPLAKAGIQLQPRKSVLPVLVEPRRSCMRTKRQLNFPENHAATRLGSFAALVGAVILAASAPTRADIPDPPSGQFAGIYKVISSTDPKDYWDGAEWPQRTVPGVLLKGIVGEFGDAEDDEWIAGAGSPSCSGGL